MDIWSPFSQVSIHGHKYFLTIVDDFNRFTWVILLKAKSEVQSNIQNFIALIERQFDSKIKLIRFDNGPEFSLKDFYASKGIIHQTSCPYTPQQNARVERKHQHILNVARALLFQSEIPNKFWSYAIKHVVFLINRVPSPVIQNKTPFELLLNNKPDFSSFKVFGSLCYASTNIPRQKLDPRSRRGVFLGFQNGTKGYIILDLDSREIFLSRNVIFHETHLPFKRPKPNDIAFNPNTQLPPLPPISFPNNTYTHVDPILPFPSLNTSTPNTSPSPIASTPNMSPSLPSPNPSLSTTHINSPSSSPPTSNSPTTTTQPTFNPRRLTRISQPSTRLRDFICSTFTTLSDQPSSKCEYPLQKVLSYSQLSPSDHKFVMSLFSEIEPSTYKEAIHNPCWIEAMNAEIDALNLNQTWDIVVSPSNVKPIGCKWVYKIKRKADGSIERYKARLVAKGFSQIEGIDYMETFSPVVKMTTIHVVLALASVNRWHLQQLDVSNAFLHGDLTEDVYMTIPPGIQGYPCSHCCKLRKSLYGLKQASRRWYEKLHLLLLSCGYQQAQADHSLFIKNHGIDFTALIIYVDDIVLAGNCLHEIDTVKQILNSNFHIKDLGNLKYFLGLEVNVSDTGISICQQKYCLELLSDSGMLACKPSTTPMDCLLRLHKDSSAPLSDPLSYRRLIGRLLYLTSTRPDITFPVQQLSQFMSNPTQTHFQAAMRVLKYLKGNPSKGLLFRRDSPVHIAGFSDADWATCIDSRQSVTGYCIFIGSSLVSWKTKKQNTVSISSSEAEYRALASTTCELQWLIYLLSDLGISCSKQLVLSCDNQSALHIAANPVFHERTKHLDIDCHLVCEKTKSGLMRLLPVSSSNQLADIFTKALPPRLFTINLSKLELFEIHSPPACRG